MTERSSICNGSNRNKAGKIKTKIGRKAIINRETIVENKMPAKPKKHQPSKRGHRQY